MACASLACLSVARAGTSSLVPLSCGGGVRPCSAVRATVRGRWADPRVAPALVRLMRGDNAVDVAEDVEVGPARLPAPEDPEDGEPLLLRMSIALVTEILRLFSHSGSSQPAAALQGVEPPPAVVENQNVLEALREDYERAYFLTGDFTSILYADDCLFADPTIQFRGRDKYQRNLKLLVPFFEEPKLTLFDVREDSKLGPERSINANWNLRTYLRLPWKPLIDVDGSTLYVMDANSKIVKHIESWSISGWQAVQQLFVPSDRAFLRKHS